MPAVAVAEGCVSKTMLANAPATNVLVVVEMPVRVLPEVSAETESVLISAFVEARVVVACPEAFVVPENAVSVFPVPVEARVSWVTLKFVTRLLFASFNVSVTVAVDVPFAVTPVVAASVEFAEAGDPAMKVVVVVVIPVREFPVESPLIERVFTSATVLFKVVVTCPEALVVPVNATRVFPVPVEERVSLVVSNPTIAVLLLSFKVRVMVEVAAPLAVILEVAVRMEFVANALHLVMLTVEAEPVFPAASDCVAAKVTVPLFRVFKFKLAVQRGVDPVAQVGLLDTVWVPSVAETLTATLFSVQDPLKVKAV